MYRDPKGVTIIPWLQGAGSEICRVSFFVKGRGLLPFSSVRRGEQKDPIASQLRGIGRLTIGRLSNFPRGVKPSFLRCAPERVAVRRPSG